MKVNKKIFPDCKSDEIILTGGIQGSSGICKKCSYQADIFPEECQEMDETDQKMLEDLKELKTKLKIK